MSQGRDQPLVSCIMPTRDRRAFVPRAIAYFLRQDYANKELVIVDDGTDPVSDLVPVDESSHFDEKTTVGGKCLCPASKDTYTMPSIINLPSHQSFIGE